METCSPVKKRMASRHIFHAHRAARIILSKLWKALSSHWRLSLELIAIAGVLLTAVGVWLQYNQFQQEAFNRSQSGLSQAWTILGNSQGIRYDMGQRSALEFLAARGFLNGDARLNRIQVSGLNFDNRISPGQFDFHESDLCKSSIYISVLPKSDFRYAILGGVAISAILDEAKFDGAYMRRMHFMTGSATKARFIAADMREITFRGGSLVEAVFDGADLRGAQFVSLKEYDGNEVDKARQTAKRSTFDKAAPKDAYLLQNNPYYVSNAKRVAEELVRVDRATFIRSDLRGADLTGSNISQDQLDQACADASTKLPKELRLKQVCILPAWVTDRAKKIRSHMWREAEVWQKECDTALKNSQQ